MKKAFKNLHLSIGKLRDSIQSDASADIVSKLTSYAIADLEEVRDLYIKQKEDK